MARSVSFLSPANDILVPSIYFFGVYAINFLWAPLVDRIRIPILTSLIGHRKAWIISLQFIILISLIYWSILNPIDNLALIVFIGLIIAISSASQDITIDALRIEQIKKDESSAMAAIEN